MNNDPFLKPRLDMVELQLRRRGIADENVLGAMESVPRHLFVSEEHRDFAAYSDGPLPIGSGQTISQPFMVALMTTALGLKVTDKVLEIGTGSGYQAAVCAELAADVYTLERIPELHNHVKILLENLGYDNIHCFLADGTVGLPVEAPFDAIIVTASAPAVPEPLKSQLKDGGRLVLPVGSRVSQNCVKITRLGNKFHEESLTGCTFVPLIGEYGWEEQK